MSDNGKTVKPKFSWGTWLEYSKPAIPWWRRVLNAIGKELYKP